MRNCKYVQVDHCMYVAQSQSTEKDIVGETVPSWCSLITGTTDVNKDIECVTLQTYVYVLRCTIETTY